MLAVNAMIMTLGIIHGQIITVHISRTVVHEKIVEPHQRYTDIAVIQDIILPMAIHHTQAHLS